MTEEELDRLADKVAARLLRGEVRRRYINWFVSVCLGLLLFFAGRFSRAAEDVLVTRTSTTRDAVAAALRDCMSMAPGDRIHQRYFWLPQGSREEHLAFRYTLNATLSNAESIQYPRVIDQNVVSVDLRSILPEHKDYVRVLQVLENYIDPYFHVVERFRKIQPGGHAIVTQPAILRSGTTKIGNLNSGSLVTVSRTQDGWVNVTANDRRGWVSQKELALVSFGMHCMPHPAVDAPGEMVNIEMLADMTASRCPIFNFPRFQTLAMSQVDGGFYYQLIGLQVGQPLKDALGLFRIDFDDYKNVDSVNRTARFVSMVANAHPRAAKFGNAPSVRPTDGPAFWTATEDITDEDINPEEDAMYNLFGADFGFEELILPRSNGFLAGLVVANERLAAEVGANIANDNQSRPPHHRKINGWFTCFRCHGQEGYQPFPNDVKLLADANGGRLPLFGDTSLSLADQIKAADKLQATYTGDLDSVLAAARRSHARQVYRACGAPYEEVYAAVVGVHAQYEYDWITPEIACRELGYSVERVYSRDFFDSLVPKLPVNSFGYSPEDPTILGLRAWKSDSKRPEIRRRNWERVFADASLRALLFPSQQQEKSP